MTLKILKIMTAKNLDFTYLHLRPPPKLSFQENHRDFPLPRE